MFGKTDKIYGKEADDGPLEEELKSFFALSLIKFVQSHVEILF